MAVLKSTNSGKKTTRAGRETARPKKSKRVNGSAAKARHDDLSKIPLWRKIEILRERAELKANLKEIWDDDVDIEDLSPDEDEEAHDRYYTAVSDYTDPLADLDEDDETEFCGMED